MIRTLVLDRATGAFRVLDRPQEIRPAVEDPGTLVWVDVSDPTSGDFQELAAGFGFHPLSIEDCRHRHQRPKVEEYQGYYFLVLYEARLDEAGELLLAELDIFIGKDYLVTVHADPIGAIGTAERLWRGWADRRERGTGLLTYLLVDAIVDEYLPLLDALSDRMEDLEERIFGTFEPAAIEDIFRIKKQMLLLRRVVTPLRDVFNVLLRREQPVFSRETATYLHDVFDHLIRVTDTIDTLRDLLGSTMDAYLSVSGNRMNMVMKRLTAISTALMSVTLIAGIYGMNFARMPELSWRWGYPAALLLMLAVGGGIVAFFRRIDWL